VTQQSQRNLSLNALRATYEPRTGDWPIVLLSIDHESLDQPLLVSSDATQRIGTSGGRIVYGTVSQGDTYTCYPFDLVMPRDEAGGVFGTQLSVDNVDAAITDALRSLTSPPYVTLEVVMGKSVDTVEFTLPDFRLLDAEWDKVSVVGTLSLEMLLNELLGFTYRPGTHPGMFK
jgi:hypothetical protein